MQPWGLVGANAGATFHPGGPGFLLGGEASLALAEAKRRTLKAWWYGAYADAVYDFSAKRTRMSIGPEIGYGVFGLDAGALVEAGGGKALFGLVVRPVLTLGAVALYGRVGVLPAASYGPLFGEAGVLLKFPWEISHQTLQWRAHAEGRAALERSIHVVRWWKVDDPQRGRLLVAEIEVEGAETLEVRGLGISMGGDVVHQTETAVIVRKPPHAPALVVVALPEEPVKGSAGLEVSAGDERDRSWFYFYERERIPSADARPLGPMSTAPVPRY